MTKLPIGIQDFSTLRTSNYLYVDKTEAIYKLATTGKYYFLSRPRRFGKSLLLSTLAELFRGNKSLFNSLWLEDQWDWTQKYPVIHIGFSSIGYKSLGLARAISERLQEEASNHNIILEREGHENQFRELLSKLSSQKGNVVLLIDEYDKPIIDYLEDVEAAKENQRILKAFYSVLKDADPQLKLLFLTGVSKFSRTSIFSELNNLIDLTVHPSYSSLTGYTQEELEHYFAPFIETLAAQYEGKEALLAEIKKWYNGYSWDGKVRVYNPFSILNFFGTGTFQNFWFESGTPTFLIKLLKKEDCYDLENKKVPMGSVGNYELDAISPETLLFQTGYLTIKGQTIVREYILDYPNLEVKESMLQYLLANYATGRHLSAASPALRMAHALLENQLEALPDQMNALLGSIPYELHQENEAYYHTVMHLAFSLMGVYIQSEVHVAKGRLDNIVTTDEAIYIFEFKVNGSVEKALQQIKDRDYAQAYLGNGKKVIGIGVNFNTTLKKIDGWQVADITE
ncbi:MAG: AAA family ATPase [Flammeovirgaceae bacterium]